MKKNLYKISLAILLLGFYFQAEALTISPAKLEIEGDPGTVLTGEIEIFNEQDTPKTFFTSYENFEPQGDSGAPYFIGAKDGLATWINVQSSVELQPGERMSVPYRIEIPASAAPGGYFSAIFFSNQPPVSESGGEVTIGGKVGMLILLRVSGYVEEKGGILDFFTINNQRFFNRLPVSFEYRLNNLGGDRIVPVGEIKIKNIFQLTSATLNANKNQGSVLPNSVRKFEVVWDSNNNSKNIPTNSTEKEEKLGFFEMARLQAKDFHFGIYTAKLDVTWGLTKQVAQESYIFFIFPWQLLSLLLGLLLIIFLIFKKGLKKYNQFVINQFNQSK